MKRSILVATAALATPESLCWMPRVVEHDARGSVTSTPSRRRRGKGADEKAERRREAMAGRTALSIEGPRRTPAMTPTDAKW